MKNVVKILLFAKAPEAGKVKTRLQPQLSPARAARLYQLLLDRVVANITTANVPVALWRAGDLDHPCWEKYAKNPLVTLHEQNDGDLGQRMKYAAIEGLNDFYKVVLIGADCIDIDKQYLESAVNKLDGNDAVIGPATDGGYVLLALKSVDDEIFSDIAWGSDKVLSQTLAKMDELNWRYELLPALNDIDRPEDLANLSAIGDW
jgi:rSAM/selenodomain-associated transferase 1